MHSYKLSSNLHAVCCSLYPPFLKHNALHFNVNYKLSLSYEHKKTVIYNRTVSLLYYFCMLALHKIERLKKHIKFLPTAMDIYRLVISIVQPTVYFSCTCFNVLLF